MNKTTKRAALTPAAKKRALQAKWKASEVLEAMRNQHMVIILDDEATLDQKNGIWSAQNPHEDVMLTFRTPVMLELLKHMKGGELVLRHCGKADDQFFTEPVLVHRDHPQIATWPHTYTLFRDKKTMAKSLVRQLKPGTWIEVKWYDTENTVELVLEKPYYWGNGVDIATYCPAKQSYSSARVDGTQVVGVVGTLQVPHI